MPLVLVRTVSGLEGLAAEEIAAAGHRVVDVSKRQLVVDATDELVRRPPRLADDQFLVRDAVPDPGRTKVGLRSVALTAVAAGPFAVSASFAGERNFNRYDVEDRVGALLGGEYYSRRNGQPPALRTDWRVVLDGKTMWVAERPYDVPLHRRPWRQRTVVGSLHPPVAAAMARLARIEPDMQVRVAVGDLTPYLKAWRRILSPGGVVVALLSQEQAELITASWTVQATYHVSVAGQSPRIVVLD